MFLIGCLFIILIFRRSAQGFVEVTIKRMESMLLDEVINLRSRGLLQYFSGSAMKVNEDLGTFEKKGRSLKIGDLLFDESKDGGTLKVLDFIYESSMRSEDLVLGSDYDIVHPREKRVRCYRLVQMDIDFDWYQFSSYEPGVRDITGCFSQLPPLYARGCGRTEPTEIIVENDIHMKRRLTFDSVKDTDFQLDVSKTHVILSLG